MAWIREEDLDVSPVIRIMSINPQAMQAVQRLNAAVTFGSSALTEGAGGGHRDGGLGHQPLPLLNHVPRRVPS